MLIEMLFLVYESIFESAEWHHDNRIFSDGTQRQEGRKERVICIPFLSGESRDSLTGSLSASVLMFTPV